jgi:hypothetical protein
MLGPPLFNLFGKTAQAFCFQKVPIVWLVAHCPYGTVLFSQPQSPLFTAILLSGVTVKTFSISL